MSSLPRQTPVNEARDVVDYGFLPPLSRQARGGLVQRIQDLVRDSIVRLELPPGSFIDKAALCERLGVSRFPVTEALGRLADEGFVEVLPQRGTRVSLIDLTNCRQAMFIRRAMEPDAIRTVTPKVDQAFLDKIDVNLAGQEEAITAKDWCAFIDRDRDFHTLFISRLGYPRVTDILSGAFASLHRLRLLLVSHRRLSMLRRDHQQIADAVRERDADKAAAEMERHLKDAERDILALAEQQPGVFSRPAR